MFAAGRVAPALRGRQSFRTNDRSRPTARRTSSGRARGSRASNKPCPRASLLHRVPNKRNRVDARAFGREWFLEKWSSGKFCWCVHREVMRKVRRTIFPHDFKMYAPASHSSFLTWLKSVFGTVVGWLTCWVRSYDSYDMEHAAPGSVLRASRSPNASSGLPGPPAGGRGKDGRIHNSCSRCSTAAQREVASLCLCTVVITFLYISSLCWRVVRVKTANRFRHCLLCAWWLVFAVASSWSGETRGVGRKKKRVELSQDAWSSWAETRRVEPKRVELSETN